MQLSLLWQNNTIGSSAGVYSTPAMADGRAYLANFFGHVFCVSLSDGEILWKFRASSAIRADVILVNDFVIVSCTNGFIYALNKSNGDMVWNCLTSGPTWDAPAVQDELLYLGTHTGDLCCLDSRNGSLLWTYRVEAPIVMTPAVSGHSVVFGTDESISCIDTLDRQLIWRHKTINRANASSPVITRIDDESGEKVFIREFHEMRCMDLLTGHVVWSFHSDGEIANQICVCRLGVIFGDTYGRKLYSLDRRSGDLQWVAPTEGSTGSPLFLADSHLLVTSNDNHLYCFEARPGKCEWKREFTPYNITRMNVLDNYLLLATHYKDVYCYEMIPDEPGH